MPIPMLDAVDFSKVPALNFVVPVVTSDPVVVIADEGRVIYNTTQNVVKYCDGVSWITLGSAGQGGPPSGTAGGDLTGSYPNPIIAPDVIVDADVNTAAAIAQSKIANLVTDLAAKATPGYVDTSIANHIAAADPHTGYQKESERGIANGYAPLDAGNLIPTVHLPPLAINDVFVVASEAAMLALTAQIGDMAIRTDISKTFVLAASPASTLVNWKEVLAPGAVISVNGYTGVVNLTAADVGAPKYFSGNVGAGTAVVVLHSLNTRDVNVDVYRATTPWDTVGCTVERTDANNITLRFATAVAANAYRVVVTGR